MPRELPMRTNSVFMASNYIVPTSLAPGNFGLTTANLGQDPAYLLQMVEIVAGDELYQFADGQTAALGV